MPNLMLWQKRAGLDINITVECSSSLCCLGFRLQRGVTGSCGSDQKLQLGSTWNTITATVITKAQLKMNTKHCVFIAAMDFVWHSLNPRVTPWKEYIQQSVANVLHQKFKKSVSGQMCNYHKRDTDLQHHSAVAGGISSCHPLQKEHVLHECFVWIRFVNENCDIGLILGDILVFWYRVVWGTCQK